MGARLALDEHDLPGCDSGRGRPGLVGAARRRDQSRQRGVARTRSRRTPLGPRVQVAVRTGSCSTSSPASRRSRTGMKLRTGGTRSKLYGGGGEVVAHSSVLPFHGSLPAISPWFQLWTTLIRKSRIENAIRNDEIVMIMFVVAQAGLAEVQMPRGMPSNPDAGTVRM